MNTFIFYGILTQAYILTVISPAMYCMACKTDALKYSSQDAEIEKRAYFSSLMPRKFERMNLVYYESAIFQFQRQV